MLFRSAQRVSVAWDISWNQIVNFDDYGALLPLVQNSLIAGALLGFAYFGTTTSMNTVMQTRVADHERGRVMSLWFMAFGGTVPIGNLIFGPLIDRYGSQWLLIMGSIWAAVLWWWCDIERIETLKPVTKAHESGDF